MIIKKQDGNLLLMNQTDHAALAGDIAAAWGNRQFEGAALADAATLAATRHDDGWAAPDAEPRFDSRTRRPLHFHEINIEEHIPLYRKGVWSVADEDSYAGLLVGMHWTGLYRGRWGMQSSKGGIKGKSPDAYDMQEEAILEEEARWARTKRTLLTELERRSEWEAQLWHTYELLQVWDLLSLFACMAPHEMDEQSAVGGTLSVGMSLSSLQQPASERLVPAPTQLGEDLTELSLKVKEPGVVTVNPYPFAEPEFRAEVKASVIPDRDYLDSSDIATSRADSESKTVSCVFTNE